MMEIRVPTVFGRRFERWIQAGHKLVLVADPWVNSDILHLGLAEAMLLELEHELLDQEQKHPGVGPDRSSFAVNAAVAHSRLWLFGLYEALRTYRQRAEKTSAVCRDIAGIPAPRAGSYAARQA